MTRQLMLASEAVGSAAFLLLSLADANRMVGVCFGAAQPRTTTLITLDGAYLGYPFQGLDPGSRFSWPDISAIRQDRMRCLGQGSNQAGFLDRLLGVTVAHAQPPCFPNPYCAGSYWVEIQYPCRFWGESCSGIARDTNYDPEHGLPS